MGGSLVIVFNFSFSGNLGLTLSPDLKPSENISNHLQSKTQERLTIVSTLMLVAATYSFGVGLPRESADFLEGLVYLTLSAMAGDGFRWGKSLSMLHQDLTFPVEMAIPGIIIIIYILLLLLLDIPT